jgi:hypothetical protein
MMSSAHDVVVDIASRGITLERRVRRIASRNPLAVLAVAAAFGAALGAVVGPLAIRRAVGQAARRGLLAGGLRLAREWLGA